MTLSKATQAEKAAAEAAAAEAEAKKNEGSDQNQDGQDKGPDESPEEKEARELKEKEEAEAAEKAAKKAEKEAAKKKAAEPTLSIREQLAIKNQDVMAQLTLLINKLHEAETFAKGNGRPFLHIFSTKQRIGGLLQQYKVNSK